MTKIVISETNSVKMCSKDIYTTLVWAFKGAARGLTQGQYSSFIDLILPGQYHWNTVGLCL